MVSLIFVQLKQFGAKYALKFYHVCRVCGNMDQIENTKYKAWKVEFNINEKMEFS